MSDENKAAESTVEKPITEMQWRDAEVRKIGEALTARRDELKKVLPADVDVDKYIRVVQTTITTTPDLLYADRRSLFSSCMEAAQDGLFLDGKEAVMNVYSCNVAPKNAPPDWVPMVEYMPMVRGILKIMRSASDVLSIDAAAVYEKDTFEFERGDDPKIVHKPYMGDEDPGQVKACYVIVRLENGEVLREVMPRRDIEKVRAASKSGTGSYSPWTKWYDQMGIKAVIKRLAKLMPQASERLQRALQKDNDALGMDFARGEQQAAIQAPEEKKKVPVVEGRPSRLTAIIASKEAAEASPGRDDGE